MQTKTAYHHNSTIMRSQTLSERVCMVCVLPECSDEDRRCLRAYMLGSRSAKADVAIMLRSVDDKLARLLSQGKKGFDVAVLCEAHDRLRSKAENLDNA